MDLQRSFITERKSQYCWRNFLVEFEPFRNKVPTSMSEFNNLSPMKQKLEKCLDNFNGPNGFFND